MATERYRYVHWRDNRETTDIPSGMNAITKKGQGPTSIRPPSCDWATYAFIRVSPSHRFETSPRCSHRPTKSWSINTMDSYKHPCSHSLLLGSLLLTATRRDPCFQKFHFTDSNHLLWSQKIQAQSPLIRNELRLSPNVRRRRNRIKVALFGLLLDSYSHTDTSWYILLYWFRDIGIFISAYRDGYIVQGWYQGDSVKHSPVKQSLVHPPGTSVSVYRRLSACRVVSRCMEIHGTCT